MIDRPTGERDAITRAVSPGYSAHCCPINRLHAQSHDESSGLSIAYRQRMSSDVAGHMHAADVMHGLLFCEKRRCSEIASTHVVDER